MPIKVNMSNVSSKFDLLPTQQFLSTFAKYEVKVAGPNAANPGSKYFNLEFHIDANEHPDFKNRRMWGTMGASVNALWAVKDFLVAMGYPAEELDAEDGDEPDELTPDQLVQAISEMLAKVVSGKVILDVVTTQGQRTMPNGQVVPVDQNKINKYISVEAA